MNSLSLLNRISRPAGNGYIPTDQILDDAFNGSGFARQHAPLVEVQESEKDYLVSVDLPGIEMKDIDLSFSEGMLTLKAHRKSDDRVLYSDRWSGTFERVVGIGADVDESQIRATFRNGVLAVTLPKSPEHLPRRIQIE